MADDPERGKAGDLLQYGRALEQERERRGLSREELARQARVSYSYLSEVERGLKRPSADVLVKLATALEMLPSDLLRRIEEFSARDRGLLRRRSFEAPAAFQAGTESAIEPLHERAGEPGEVYVPPARAPETGMRDDTAEAKLVTQLVQAAIHLSAEDITVLLDLARRLAAPKRPER